MYPAPERNGYVLSPYRIALRHAVHRRATQRAFHAARKDGEGGAHRAHLVRAGQQARHRPIRLHANGALTARGRK